MTIDDVTRAYNQQYDRQRAEWQAWDAKYKGVPYMDRPKYTGFYVDFTMLMDMLLTAIQEEYGFSLARAQHIRGRAYETGHSSGGDIFLHAGELCEFIKSLPD